MKIRGNNNLCTPSQLIHQQVVLPDDAQEVSTLHPLQEHRPATFWFHYNKADT